MPALNDQTLARRPSIKHAPVAAGPDASFPPVFIISLQRSAERRKFIAERLDRLGIPYVFFEAVNGGDLDLRSLPIYDGPRRRRLFGRDMTRGEMGCLMSHRAIYQEMADRNLEKAIILEDDVMFSDSFPGVIRRLMDMPVRWDMVRFLDKPKVYERSRTIGPVCDQHVLVRPATPSGGGYAYLLTLHAAKTLLEHTRKNAIPIDITHSYVWKTKLETFAVKPSPVIHDDDVPSTIGEARFNKTLQISGWTKTFYPLTRFWLRCYEFWGKRAAYILSLPRDIQSARELKRWRH